MDFDSDGIRLHYEVHGPGDGSAIVLVHGFASDYQLNWVGTRWQETLTTAGFRVVGLDCRGHGSSDKPHDPAAYALETMAADVRRLLDHLEIETANYLGYSMGGKIGVQAMLDFPKRLERVVLGGVGWGGPFRAAPQIAKAMRGGPIESPVAQTFYNFAKARPSNDLEALAACIPSPTPRRWPRSRTLCWWWSATRTTSSGTSTGSSRVSRRRSSSPSPAGTTCQQSPPESSKKRRLNFSAPTSAIAD